MFLGCVGAGVGVDSIGLRALGTRHPEGLFPFWPTCFCTRTSGWPSSVDTLRPPPALPLLTPPLPLPAPLASCRLGEMAAAAEPNLRVGEDGVAILLGCGSRFDQCV